MKGFRFYSKNDSLKESIGTWVFNNLEEAYRGFAERKRLSVENFKKLFIVEHYDSSRSEKEN